MRRGGPTDTSPDSEPGEKRPILAVLSVLAVLDVVLWVAVFAQAGGSPGSPSAGAGAAENSHVASAGPTAGSEGGGGGQPDERVAEAGGPQRSIELASASYAGTTFETVAISGVLDGAPAGTTLRVQHREQGRWVSFPLPTTTDAAGRFTAYVEMGAPGSYELRVLDPATRRTSRVVTLQVG